MASIFGISDWIISFSFLVIGFELFYLSRKRPEFAACPVHMTFMSMLFGSGLLFLMHAMFGDPPTESWPKIRMVMLEVFIVAGAVYTYTVIRKILNLPKMSQLQEMVKERTATLQSVIDNSPIAIVRVKADSTVESWNPAAEDLFGWRADEIIGRKAPFIPEEKKAEFEHIFRSTLLNKHLPPIATRRVRKDGSPIDVCIWNAPVRGGPPNADTAMAMIADITQQRQVANELDKAKQRAERANIAKTKFLAHMSHEIRTPLTAILGFSELLTASCNGDEQTRSYVEAISRNGQALAGLIDDLLDLSKIEAGEMKMIETPLQTRDLMDDVKASLELKAKEKGIFLHFTVDDEVPSQICSDPLRLRQIIVNIVGNAVKFTDKGGVAVNVSYRRGDLMISVVDSGPGLTVEQATKLFKPFTQAHNRVSHKFGGTGLGLSLSRELARLLGGEIELKHTEVGVGSEFVITVPAKPSMQKPRLVRSEVPEYRPEALRGRKILVADDAEDNLALITHYLEDAGAIVVTASDGEEAIHKALGQQFDAVLMDIQMPKVDGIAAMKELRSQNYNRDIIALTAHALPEERQHCLSLGFSDYVSKPVKPKRLVQTLAAHLAT